LRGGKKKTTDEKEQERRLEIRGNEWSGREEEGKSASRKRFPKGKGGRLFKRTT